MASVLCYEDLTCSVCLSIFTDPVTLPCGHSFCRQCVTVINSCPQCRTALSTEVKCLPTSFILKSLADKARETEKMKEESEKAEVSDLCPEHEEKLKLFCITEQQLACIICRDGERHEGHKLKPIKEAAASLRKELETFVQHVSDDIHAIESLANTQREEITKTIEKSEQLKTQIRRQFEEMHQFLQRREDEIKNELKHKEEDNIEKMSQSLNTIETALSERKEMEVKATSVLKISDSEKFLKSWTECKRMMTTVDLLKPRLNELQVVNTSLSLGPYESHLQFFMWKEMLQVIQPRAERLSLKSNSKVLSVSDDGRRLFSAPKSRQAASFSTLGNSGFGVQTGFNTTQSGFSFGSCSPQARPFGTGYSVAPTFSQSGKSVLSVSDDGRSLFSAPKSNQAASFSKSGPSVFGVQTTQSTSGFGSSQAKSFGRAPTFGGQSKNVSSSSSASLFGSSTNAQSSGLFGSVTVPTFGGKSENVSSSSTSCTEYAYSVTAFTSGQHYWEVEVGSRDYWELGLKDNSLKYELNKYYTFHQNKSIVLVFEGRPRKIGVYLNCSSKKLSFYDADNIKLIHTVSPDLTSMPVSAYFNIRHQEPDHNPITVCWY